MSDIVLLADIDDHFDTPSDTVIKKLCERAYSMLVEAEYKIIANISVSPLYNLRDSTGYQKQRKNFKKTKSR